MRQFWPAKEDKMRIERSITTVSWIPSDLLEGMGRMATRMKMAHHDPPPPESLGDDIPGAIAALKDADRFRFANHMRVFIDVDESDAIVGSGHLGAGFIGATTIGLGVGEISVPAVQLPDQHSITDAGPTSVRFTQTVGGRTGTPMPRAVKHPPFIQYHAPIVWTTLELVVHTDGSHQATMTGASGFPRHWVYDTTGTMVAKSSVAEYKKWMSRSFGHRTPWGDEDSPAIVSRVESALEHELQTVIMHGAERPRIRRVKPGKTLIEQGEKGNDLFLLLNGVFVVEVDGEAIAELGPGATVGEGANVEGGLRNATLRARTECKVAAISPHTVDHEKLAALAARRSQAPVRPA